MEKALGPRSVEMRIGISTVCPEEVVVETTRG